MKYLLKIMASSLLLFTGAGAIYGGWSLMTQPDGSDLLMPLSYLIHSPFSDYFMPGLVLFVFNGLLSLFTLGAMLFGYKNYAWLIIIQGSVLTVWIVIQILMIRTIVGLHVMMFMTGILLMFCGLLLMRILAKSNR